MVEKNYTYGQLWSMTMFLVLNMDLSYRRYKNPGLKCLFRHNLCRRSLPHLEKNYPYLLIFAPIKDFLDVYNVEQPG